MKVEFLVGCMGYSVGGYRNTFDIEIDDNILQDVKERGEDLEDFIYEYIHEYVLEELEICIKDLEKDE